MDIRLERLISVLDPARDRELETFTDQELADLIPLLLGILGQAQRSHLEYVLRNLRRRVLYHMTPKRLLLRSLDAFEIRPHIETDLQRIMDRDSAVAVAREVHQIIVELYWTDRNYDVTEIVPKLARRDGPHCQICGYQFRQSDTDIAEAKELFSDTPYPMKNGFYDCLKPLSKKVRHRHVTVDHVVPLDSFGKDHISNYRLACQQCNNGKRDYLSFVEPRFAVGHRERQRLPNLDINEPSLFYAVIARDRRCTRCQKGTEAVEFTLKPISPEKCVMFDTLTTVCYDCDDFPRRWKRVGASTVEDEEESEK